MILSAWRPALGVVLCSLLASGEARAQLQHVPLPASEREPPASPLIAGAVLPPHLMPEPSGFLRLGVGAERFGNGNDDSDYMLAISGVYRYRAFGPNASFLAKPRLGTTGYEESRFLLGLGLRGYYPVLGTEVSYGVGLLGELRFQEHFWLLQGTPLELSAVVYRKRTFEIELTVGMRIAMAGKLIDSFLLDPNGFQNEAAQANLDRALHEDRARGFIRLVFSRRVD